MNSELSVFIKYYHKFVIISSLAATVAVFGWSAIQVPKFSSYSRVLVIAKNYDMAKALQTSARMAQIWQEIIRSTSFLNSVLGAGFSIDRSEFTDVANQQEVWQKTVKVKSVPNSGILKIEIISSSRHQALLINQAIHAKLASTASDYFGYGNDVKILDKARISGGPTHPNLWLNSLIALILGLSAAIILSCGHYYIKGQTLAAK